MLEMEKHHNLSEYLNVIWYEDIAEAGESKCV